MDALILMDMQNDFLPGGALAVPEGDAIIPLLNDLQRHFEVIVATQDWHPRNHSSFASNHPGARPLQTVELDGRPQTLWPDHCIQGTSGAQLAAALNTCRADAIIRKGTDSRVDSYSTFYDNQHRRVTGLAGYLRERRVTRVVAGGLAGDFCVFYSLMDARKLGFEAVLLQDATRPISQEGFDKALARMRSAGVVVTDSASFLGSRRDIGRHNNLYNNKGKCNESDV